MRFQDVRLALLVSFSLFLGGSALADDAPQPNDETPAVVQEEPDAPIEPEVEAPTDNLVSPDVEALAASTTITSSSTADADFGKAWGIQPTLGDVTNNGAFSYRYPFDIPAFRGLEPKLALTYNSSRKTRTGGEYQGWLGYGWGLSGVPVIERAGYLQGVPQYKIDTDPLNDDIYLLNGEPLAACKTTGASCTNGGNWVSEVENYLRIKYDSTTNVWKVTARDGTITTFTAVGALPGAPATLPGDVNDDVRLHYRWLATEMADTLGNKVAYSYSCTDLPVCYPTTITYHNVGTQPSTPNRTIQFYYEDRPDPILSANGHGLSKTRQRLKTVLIKTVAAMTHGYKISYDVAPLSGASRLIAAQQFGSDLGLDANNAIIEAEGTALPATSFAYNDATGFSAKTITGLNGMPIKRVEKKYTKNDPFGDRTTYEKTFWTTAFAAIDVDLNGITEILKSKYTSFGDTTCSHALFHAPTRTSTFTEQALSLKCPGFMYTHAITTADGMNLAKVVQGLSVGRFGNDKTKQQLIVLDVAAGSSSTAPNSLTMRWQAELSKSGDTFTASIKDCLAAEGASNAVTDTELKALCGKAYPTVYATDWDGDGRDSLSVRGAGMTATLFGDSRQQRIVDEDDHTDYHYQEGTEVKSKRIGNFVCKSDCTVADINGDGLDDVVYILNFSSPLQGSNTNRVYVNINTGDRFITWINGQDLDVSGGAQVLATDSDGDGRAELLVASRPSADGLGNKDWNIFRISANGVPVKDSAIDLRTSFTTTGDFNGDGQTDLLVAPITNVSENDYYDNSYGDQIFNYAAYSAAFFQSFEDRFFKIYYGAASNGSAASGGIAHLLHTVSTPQGGQVQAAYLPSTAYDNIYLPYSMPTVSSLSVLDGRGQTAITKYAYADGNYDIGKRRFLGFGTVTKTLPKISGDTNAPVVRTTYKQTLATIGLPSKTEYLDDDGVVNRTVAETYVINTSTVPFTAENTETVTTHAVTSLTATLKTTRVFDDYGNLTEQLDHGRTDVTGDEILSQSYFNPNVGAYIVSLPRLTRSYQVDAAGNKLLKAQGFLYDGLAYGSVPTEGKVTGRRDYKTSSSYQLSVFDHDAYGNVTTSTNGEDETTTYAYDSPHRLFVTKTTYPNGLIETAVPNAACSAPASSTGLNGVATTYTYDVFCRPTRVENAVTGSYTTTAYQSFGDPDAQRIRTSTSRPNSTTTADQYQYFDGLGRVRKVTTTGDSSSPTSYVDTDYDLRGNVSNVSLPYIADATVYSTVTNFDWANRPIKITNPDASYKSLIYRLQATSSASGNIPLEYTRVTDEEGDYSYTYISTNGDVIGKYQRSATAEDGTYDGRWIHGATFDGAHRMIGAKSTAGSIWVYTYDTMGNRLTADDPDLGKWSYAYDNANRLIKQTDARGNVTTITYEGMGRPVRTEAFATAADATAGTGGVLLSENKYNEPVSGYYNKGQLTTSYNGLSRQVFRYNADGLATVKQVTMTDSTLPGGTLVHTETTGYDEGRQPIWKTYGATESNLSVGSASGPWAYNRKGQLTSIPGYITATTYEPDGQTASITYANGVMTSFTYDPARRWLKSFSTNKDATVLVNGIYTRDKTGRILSINASGTSNDWTYTYDGFGRIAKTLYAGNPDSSYSEDFTYYENDNLRTRSRLTGSFVYPSATADRPHAPLSLNGVAFTYDANGNMLADGNRVFTYDRANRVASVQTGANPALNLQYGPDGARAKKSSSATGSTFYIDANVEYDLAGATFTRFPHMDVKVKGATQSFLHRDHLSSVRAVTDINGAIEESTRYVVYGEPSNKAMDTQKNYIGERFDPESGLLYLNARYMDPKFGRFISPDNWDPTMEGVGTNIVIDRKAEGEGAISGDREPEIGSVENR